MCYSAEVSFLTWGFGMMCAAVLASLGKPVKSFLFPLVLTQMQLIEGLRWIHAVDERILALLGKLAIALQPAAAFYEAGKTNFILPYLGAYALLELVRGSRDLRFVVAEDGHLQWKWLFDPVSADALFHWTAFLVSTSFLYYGNVGFFFLALFVYFYINHEPYNTYGSLWCIWANLVWIYYLLR
jgi:hypothetical protein